MYADNNYINTNETFPIIDMIRRELAKNGLYSGNGSDSGVIDQILPDPEVISVEVLRELPKSPALVTSVIYTYDNGTIEKMTLTRDNSMIVVGFLIEISGRTLVGEQLEEETDMSSFSTVTGTIIREGGLFKSLKLEYTKAV